MALAFIGTSRVKPIALASSRMWFYFSYEGNLKKDLLNPAVAEPLVSSWRGQFAVLQRLVFVVKHRTFHCKFDAALHNLHL